MTTDGQSGWQKALMSAAAHWQGLALVVVLVMGLVGLVISPAPDESLPRFGLFLVGLALYALVTLAVTTQQRFWAAFLVLPLLALAVSGLALTATAWLTSKFPPAEIIVQQFPRLSEQWLMPLGQPDGLHPNPVTAITNLLLLPMLGVLLFAPASRQTNRLPLRLLIAVCTLASLPLLLVAGLSLARGALVSLALAGLALVASRGWRWGFAAALLAAVAGIAAFTAMPDWLLGKLFYSDLVNPDTYAGPTRGSIWAQSWQLFLQSPHTGIGLAAFPHVYQQADTPVPLIITHAHNIFLQAALDLGWPGALAYTALIAGAIVGAARAGLRLARGARAGAALGLAASLLGFVLFGMVDAVTVTARAGLIVWYVLGLAAAAPNALLDAPGVPAETSG